MSLRKLFLFILTVSPLFLLAQPTMTSSWVAQIGDEIMSSTAETTPDPGNEGANVLWDFSGVIVADTSVTPPFIYVPSDTTKYFDNFPSSNVCLFGPDVGLYTYYDRNEQRWESLGSEFQNFRRVFTDPQTLVTFPFTYQSQAADEFTSVSSFSGVMAFGTGQVTIEGDAYGTVMLPGSSFNNVLRVKSVIENVDSTDLGLGIIEKVHTTTTSYIWASADHGGALASHVTTEGFTVAIVPPLPSDTAFFGPTSVFSFDPSAVMAHRVELKEDAFDLTVSPNPFSDHLRLSFEMERPEIMQFELQDIQGRVIFREELHAIAGSNAVEVTPIDLAPGAYVGLLYSPTTGTSRTLIKWGN